MTQFDPPTLDYAGPRTAHPGQVPQGVWRDGNAVVMGRFAQLPGCCIKCGQPAIFPLRRTLYWHEAWLYITILAGILIYAILALVLRKSAVVFVPLCDAHRASRRNHLLISALLMIGGPFLAIGGGIAEIIPLVPAGIACFIIGIVWLAVAGQTVRPKRIDEYYIWFKGARDPFLSMLPPIHPGYAAPPAGPPVAAPCVQTAFPAQQEIPQQQYPRR